ncbi:MAG: virulence RhuM family protein [Kiritimatiellae bacterium]|jgi:hypothetical protein|nr:virulence RhuM family protein [Kiritimatiellia bacterium]
MDKQIIVYEPTEQVKMEVKTDGETVWLTIDQMAMLFGRDKSVIGKHVRNVFAEGELPEEGFRQILPKTSVVGGRPFAIYNLDVVISVGYRVKSFEGTRFRQWATRVLREMLLKRVEDVREIAKLKRRMDAAEGDIKQIKGGMNYLVKQLSGPEMPRHKIGFGAKPGETSAAPYGRAK